MYSDKAVLYAFQNIYEPQYNKSDDTWLVNFKSNDGKWCQKSFITKDGAYMFYYGKMRQLKTFYTNFLREQKIR